MSVCNQTFEDLPDQLEQLVTGCEGRAWQRRQIPTWRDREYSPPRRVQSTTAGDLPTYRSPLRVEHRGRMGSGTSSNEASPGCSPTSPLPPRHNQLHMLMP
ncbi:hypothetical protein E2320_002297 [Naja naja]|nr:hypothetical protein E2320_002297 [Naja naja]